MSTHNKLYKRHTQFLWGVIEGAIQAGRLLPLQTLKKKCRTEHHNSHNRKGDNLFHQ